MPVYSQNLPQGVSGGTALDVATWMALRGYPVHPLAPGTKTPAPNCPGCRGGLHSPQDCMCRSQGRWCHGFHAATTDLRTLQAWWAAEPEFGIGVSCGPAGLVVIDVDAHADSVPARERLLPGIPIDERVDLTGLGSGYDTLALLAAYRSRPDPCEDTSTLRVRTPSGGMHIWYRLPKGGPRLRCSSGSSSKVALAWQVDVRAVGGYIVAPTTRTAAACVRGAARCAVARGPAAVADRRTRADRPRRGHGRCGARGGPCGACTGFAWHWGPAGRAAGSRGAPGGSTGLRVQPGRNGLQREAQPGGVHRRRTRRGGHLPAGECRRLLLEAADHARPHQTRRNVLIVEAGLRAGSDRPIHPKERP